MCFGNREHMHILIFRVVVVQLLSSVRLFADPMDCSTPGFPVLHYLLEFAQILVHCLLTPLLLASVFPSIRVFSNELALLIRGRKYWRFRFSLSSSNGYSGLISSRIDWFDLLVVQGTLKSFSSTTVQKNKFFSTLPSL